MRRYPLAFPARTKADCHTKAKHIVAGKQPTAVGVPAPPSTSSGPFHPLLESDKDLRIPCRVNESRPFVAEGRLSLIPQCGAPPGAGQDDERVDVQLEASPC